jgi:hypothetical protein
VSLALAWALVLGCALWLAGCASDQFERVQEMPEGIQIDAVASGWTNRSYASQVSDRYGAPYATVWAATLRVAKRVKQMGVKPAMILDPVHGQIQIRESRMMSQDADYDPDGLRLRGWIDEFRFQVTVVSGDRTKVTVSRTVRGIPSFRICAYVMAACGGGYEPEVSNGKVEDWILTQIEDDLAQRQ